MWMSFVLNLFNHFIYNMSGISPNNNTYLLQSFRESWWRIKGWSECVWHRLNLNCVKILQNLATHIDSSTNQQRVLWRIEESQNSEDADWACQACIHVAPSLVTQNSSCSIVNNSILKCHFAWTFINGLSNSFPPTSLAAKSCKL